MNVQPYISTLIAVFTGTLWLLMETFAVPRNDQDWPNLHRWLKEVCRIVFAAAVLATLLRLNV
jgi:hypothetical protein